MSAEILSGIAPLAKDYDVFVVDLWGTLHNGIKPYPGAVNALAKLARAGKRVVLLSNAPRRAALAEEGLTAMGFAPHLYAVLMTSGESVHAALRDRSDDWHRKLAGPCWHLGPTRDRSVFEGLGIPLLSKPDGAGFCVATGPDLNDETLDDHRPALDRALARNLPMICANPDVRVPVGEQLVICAGAFADYYARNGGDVVWHGKPYPPVYARLFAALEALGGGPIDKRRTIAIGDGLPTDIAGAVNVGIASALVLSGIHRPDVKFGFFGKPDRESVGDLLIKAPAAPTYVVPRLTW